MNIQRTGNVVFFKWRLAAMIDMEASLFQRGEGSRAPFYINAPAWVHTRISKEDNSF
jgi:hypothetical protein